MPETTQVNYAVNLRVWRLLSRYPILDLSQWTDLSLYSCSSFSVFPQPLARLGAQVTGLDASRELIDAAKWHAEQDPDVRGRINYVCSTVEELCSDPSATRFDGVIASEVLEHVADQATFISSCCKLVKVLRYSLFSNVFISDCGTLTTMPLNTAVLDVCLLFSERSIRTVFIQQFMMCCSKSGLWEVTKLPKICHVIWTRRSCFFMWPNCRQWSWGRFSWLVCDHW